MRKTNKKADLAVTLLVFMSVALAGVASIIFITSERGMENKIVDARFMDEVYLKEELINFYINEIMEKAAVKDRTQEEIISNFSAELEKYKDQNGNYVLQELSQVEGQINNIKVENNKAEAEFEIMLKGNVAVKEKKAEKELFSAIYTYNKKFDVK